MNEAGYDSLFWITIAGLLLTFGGFVLQAALKSRCHDAGVDVSSASGTWEQKTVRTPSLTSQISPVGDHGLKPKYSSR